MESMRQLVKLRTFRLAPCTLVSVCAHCFSLLQASPTSHADLINVLGGAKKNWAFWAASHMDGKIGCSLDAHFLLVREITSGGHLSVLKCTTLGKE